jgi:hypothetical protein
LAITVLLAGKTDQEAATAAGVARETICRWRSSCPFFEAEFNKRRQEIWLGHKERLRSLIGKAIDAIEVALEKGDASVALKILSCGRGLDTIQSPEGPTDPKAILRCEAYERARREFDANLVDGLLYPHEVKPLAEKYFKQLLEKHGLS